MKMQMWKVLQLIFSYRKIANTGKQTVAQHQSAAVLPFGYAYNALANVENTHVIHAISKIGWLIVGYIPVHGAKFPK